MLMVMSKCRQDFWDMVIMDAVVNPLAVAPRINKSVLAQKSQLVGNRALLEVESQRDFPHSQFRVDERPQNAKSRRGAKCFGGIRQQCRLVR